VSTTWRPPPHVHVRAQVPTIASAGRRSWRCTNLVGTLNADRFLRVAKKYVRRIRTLTLHGRRESRIAKRSSAHTSSSSSWIRTARRDLVVLVGRYPRSAIYDNFCRQISIKAPYGALVSFPSPRSNLCSREEKTQDIHQGWMYDIFRGGRM